MTASGLALVLLLAVLFAGVAAGRSRKGRLTALLTGLVAIGGLSWLVALASRRLDATAPPDRMAVQLTELYSVAVPLLVAYVAGWMCARAGWTARLVVLAGAAVLLAVLPYPELGRMTAGLVVP